MNESSSNREDRISKRVANLNLNEVFFRIDLSEGHRIDWDNIEYINGAELLPHNVPTGILEEWLDQLRGASYDMAFLCLVAVLVGRVIAAKRASLNCMEFGEWLDEYCINEPAAERLVDVAKSVEQIDTAESPTVVLSLTTLLELLPHMNDW